MNARTLMLLAALILIGGGAPRAVMAQGSSWQSGHSDNPNGPTVSPYMNLLQNNNQLNTAPTYQSLVKPLVDQRNAIQRQGSGLQRLQQQVSSGAAGGSRNGGTGHATRFMNFSHFYPGMR